jgi:hypothetical protein
MEIVSKMLGHTSIRTTQIYAIITYSKNYSVYSNFLIICDVFFVLLDFEIALPDGYTYI